MHGQEGKARLEALTEETRYTTSELSLEVSGSFLLAERIHAASARKVQTRGVKMRVHACPASEIIGAERNRKVFGRKKSQGASNN